MCTYGVGCLEEKSGEKAVVQVTCFLAEKKNAHRRGKNIPRFDFRKALRTLYNKFKLLIYFIRPGKTISEPHK